MDIDRYWELTLAEMIQIVNSYNRRQEVESRNYYNLAKMTAAFVGLSMSGKHIPEYEELFKAVAQPAISQKEKEEKDMLLYLEQFKDYANQHNRIRSGNGTN